MRSGINGGAQYSSGTGQITGVVILASFAGFAGFALVAACWPLCIVAVVVGVYRVLARDLGVAGGAHGAPVGADRPERRMSLFDDPESEPERPVMWSAPKDVDTSGVGVLSDSAPQEWKGPQSGSTRRFSTAAAGDEISPGDNVDEESVLVNVPACQDFDLHTTIQTHNWNPTPGGPWSATWTFSNAGPGTRARRVRAIWSIRSLVGRGLRPMCSGSEPDGNATTAS